MFSVSPAEIITIAIVALLVFGPRRLPEIARRAGKVLRDVRSAARELKTGLEAEYKDVVDPIADAGREVKAALSGEDDSRPRIGGGPDPADAAPPNRSEDERTPGTGDAASDAPDPGSDEPTPGSEEAES